MRRSGSTVRKRFAIQLTFWFRDTNNAQSFVINHIENQTTNQTNNTPHTVRGLRNLCNCIVVNCGRFVVAPPAACNRIAINYC